MICSRHIALSLATLSGVAIFAILRRKNYPLYVVNKKNIDDQLPDIVSQLPDDILVSIITRMPTKFAVRTSILSKRWRNIYKVVSSIDLSCRDLWRGHPPAPNVPEEFVYALERAYSEGIMCSLELFLYLHSGHKIHSFKFKCCLTKSYIDRFERCIISLGNLGVKELVLFFSGCLRPSDISFSFHLLSEIPSLEYFWLGDCSLQPNLKSQCNSLRTLKLQCVTVFPGSLECILSNCLRLHSLSLAWCDCPAKLCFSGSNLQLKSLLIVSCRGAEEIEFCASNLTTFEFQNPELVNLIFDHVPQLQTIHLSLKEKNLMSYVFEKLAKDLPQLKSVTFGTRGDFYQESGRLMRMGIETFSNLRRLELSICCTPETNLLALVPFLQSCPLLQEFHLDAPNLKYDGPQPVTPAVLHSELKKVEIRGFSGSENEIEFVLYILKSAVSLEQMRISRCPKHYLGFGKWRVLSRTPWSEETHKKIQKQLQFQALSKTAQVIIQNAS